jgi:hypothetical protein
MKTPELRTFVHGLNTALTAMVTAGELDAALKDSAFRVILDNTLRRNALEVY